MDKMTIYSWALAVMLIAAPVTVAVAQMSSAPEAPAKGQDVAGTISQVDAAANSLTIKKKDSTDATFKADTATTITLDGKAAKLADLKSGHEVSLTMDGLKVVSIKASSKPTT
jgi:hypothetical protein